MIVLEDDAARIVTLDAGRVCLDGGAMFGVVPKPLWSRKIPADQRNRISLAMRALLIETAAGRAVVDTGSGNKADEKFRDIYGIENEGRPTRLEDSLRNAGVEPEQVDFVICTHLHFDHAGGSTWRSPSGELRPAFSNARYIVRRGEWEYAHRRNERIRASYLPADFEPVAEAGQLDLIDEDGEILPGVEIVRTPGHTPHHQSVLVRVGGQTVFFVADLAPTESHLPLPWIMGYDVEPLVTLETKRSWLTRAGEEGWILVFPHDPEIEFGIAGPRSRGGGCELVTRHGAE